MDFNKFLDERISKIKSVLGNKEKEYAVDGNRFHNFYVASRINNTTPQKALHGMMLKHEVSVMDMIESDDICNFSDEHISEKIGDFINYLILLEGMIYQMKEERKNDKN